MEHGNTRDERSEYWKATGYIPPDEQKSVYTPVMLREGYRLVRRGQGLEPDNAFFDWMKIHLLLVQRRDREALELLERAVRKPVYNEHITEVMAAQVTAAEAVRPLLADERIPIVDDIQFPDWSLSRHMRGTLLWRLSQLEESGRHEDAIAVGRALRRMSVMQMRASPFWLGNLVAGSGLAGVWTTGQRKSSAIPKATKNFLLQDEKRYSNFTSHRYFQYLSEHGYRELLPEARAQLAEYQTVRAQRAGVNRSSFFDPAGNLALLLSNALWSLGGWCLAGFLLSGLGFLLLLPVGLRSALSDVAPRQWPPSRGAFYPQLICWGGVVLCMGYASYLQIFENRDPSCTPDTLDLRAPSIIWSCIALLLPFAAALANQKFAAKRAPSIEEPESRSSWTSDWRQLGVPEQVFPILSRSWRIFMAFLYLVALLCAPLSLALLGPYGARDWSFLSQVDIFFLRIYLPSIEAMQFVTPTLAVSWVLFQGFRWAVFTRRTERAVTFRSIRDFRRCCGSYAVVFSWLLLLALMANLPVQAQLDDGLRQFMNQAARRTQIVLMEPAPVPKAIQALPPIPVFPTPTPAPTLLPEILPPD